MSSEGMERVREQVLLRRMLVTSYMVTRGIGLVFVHGKGCKKTVSDGKLRDYINEAGARSILELKVAIRTVLAMAGYDGCKVDKGNSVGIFFEDSSPDLTYVPGTVSVTEESSGWK